MKWWFDYTMTNWFKYVHSWNIVRPSKLLRSRLYSMLFTVMFLLWVHNLMRYIVNTFFVKGQLISKCLWCLQFLPKHERKQVDLRYHSSWVELFRSSFGRIECRKMFFWNQLTFKKTILNIDFNLLFQQA